MSACDYYLLIKARINSNVCFRRRRSEIGLRTVSNRWSRKSFRMPQNSILQSWCSNRKYGAAFMEHCVTVIPVVVHQSEFLQQFDHFVDKKFKTIKRYGGEGAESAMLFYDELFRLAAHREISLTLRQTKWSDIHVELFLLDSGGIEDVVVCIAHRGRLNLLSCVMNLPPVNLFRKVTSSFRRRLLWHLETGLSDWLAMTSSFFRWADCESFLRKSEVSGMFSRTWVSSMNQMCLDAWSGMILFNFFVLQIFRC